MRTRGAARRAAQAAVASASSDAGTDCTAKPTAFGAQGSPGGLVPTARSDVDELPASSELLGPSNNISSSPTPGTKRKLEEASAEPSATKTTAKRTRQAKKTAQPVKGGWVLPHGMGSATQSPAVPPTATEVTSDDRETEIHSASDGNSQQESQTNGRAITPEAENAPTQPLAAPMFAQASKKAAPEKATAQKTAPKKAASKKATLKTTTRQTHISSRFPKADIQAKSVTAIDKSHQVEAVVKQEETIKDISSVAETATAAGDTEGAAKDSQIIQQEEIPTITRRVTRSRAAALTQNVAKDDHDIPDQPLVVTKKEEVTEVKTSTVVVTRKLLIFRGVTLNGNLISKSLEKILVDASQILDPDYRINVKRGKDNPYGLTPGYSPYPYRRVPTPEACEQVHRILTEMHGEVKQPDRIPAASLEIAGCGEVPCVLDALLRTLISGNTLMATADAAIKKLGEDFGIRTEGTGAGSINWEKVRVSSHQALVNSIKISGNGPKKAQHIKLILDKVYEENLERMKQAGIAEKKEDGTTHDLLSLDYMHAMTKDQAMDKFVSFPGIGIKTAACVSLFCLRMPCFAVDTHVHKFCRWLGWTPVKADPDNVFRHGDFMVPDHLKYGLHQLFIRHGQTCFKCRKMTKPGTKDWNEAPDCPLEHLLDRSKDEAKPPKPKKSRRVKKEKEENDEDFGEDRVAVKEEELENSDAEDENEEEQVKEDNPETEEDDDEGENEKNDEDGDDDVNGKGEDGSEDVVMDVDDEDEKDDEDSDVEMEG